jgi:hypothetical protein
VGKTEMTERFFISTPTPTGRTTEPSRESSTVFSIYLDASGNEMRWSASFPIPPIGARVYCTMNHIGWARVVGYFESAGFVGVMANPSNPPPYYRRQTREARKEHKQGARNYPRWVLEGTGCFFGAEISLTKPKQTIQSGGGR